MTQAEIEKLAREFIDSLTPREYFFEERANKSGESIAETNTAETEEHIGCVRKAAIIINKVQEMCKDPEEVEEVLDSIWSEVDKILESEPIIDAKAEVIETKKGLEGSSTRRLS